MKHIDVVVSVYALVSSHAIPIEDPGRGDFQFYLFCFPSFDSHCTLASAMGCEQFRVMISFNGPGYHTRSYLATVLDVGHLSHPSLSFTLTCLWNHELKTVVFITIICS